MFLVNVSLRALIRAGRFDTRINTTLPDVRARHKILEVHASKVKLHEGQQIGTVGTVGLCHAMFCWFQKSVWKQ